MSLSDQYGAMTLADLTPLVVLGKGCGSESRNGRPNEITPLLPTYSKGTAWLTILRWTITIKNTQFIWINLDL